MNRSSRKIADGCTIDDFLAELSRGREIFTLAGGLRMGQYHLVRADHWDADKHTLGAFRQIEPLKSILFQPREFFGPTLQTADDRIGSARLAS